MQCRVLNSCILQFSKAGLPHPNVRFADEMRNPHNGTSLASLLEAMTF
jgi:hypothetical protein